MTTKKQAANQRAFAKAAKVKAKPSSTKKSMPSFLKKKLGRKGG